MRTAEELHSGEHTLHLVGGKKKKKKKEGKKEEEEKRNEEERYHDCLHHEEEEEEEDRSSFLSRLGQRGYNTPHRVTTHRYIYLLIYLCIWRYIETSRPERTEMGERWRKRERETPKWPRHLQLKCSKSRSFIARKTFSHEYRLRLRRQQPGSTVGRKPLRI